VRDAVCSSGALEAEAHLFGRYLVGRTPPADHVARYCAATCTLWPAAVPPAEAALVAFVRRHPWSLGPLDAAAALLQPGGQLRGKILTMTAVLEASPDFADEFLPRSVSGPAFVGRLLLSGVVAVALALVGLPLYLVATRRRA
jgi:hypothetical protein